MVYAGFWRRFGALCIDALILLIPTMVLGSLIPVAGGIVVGLFYFPVFDSSETRGTPGRLFMGLRLVTEAGNRLTFQQALVRHLLSYISGLCLCIGYLFNLFTVKRQTFHDLMVGTVVLHLPEAISMDVDWVGVWKRQMKALLRWGNFSGDEPVSPTSASAMAALEQLHKLYQQGALSEAEYHAKKEELLKKI
ncbi:MAG: RDD family protein [Bdellovibrionaceae bacterium]|nr:RDD family protein [Pseudobdellovibrionaceae bacterium]